MFIRKKKNKSGKISIQLISKETGKYKVLKSYGSSDNKEELDKIYNKARIDLYNLEYQSILFLTQKDMFIEELFSQIHNLQIKTIGPEYVFGRIYNHIGYNKVNSELFKSLVISRICFPLSKLKTIEYLYRYQGKEISVDKIYRYLDEITHDYKQKIEKISFKYIKQISKNQITIVFYDMTTLYFESSDEDDLRKMGFSKEGKHKNPQIYLGLLVTKDGYALTYDIYEGNIYEGHTLIPTLENLQKKYKIEKPIIVADSGLINSSNILNLDNKGYKYIIGARIKNEAKGIKEEILNKKYKNGEVKIINKSGKKLLVQYSENRAKRDEKNRKKGIQRLEKQIKSGRLTKQNINNRGYNKYLKIDGKLKVEIDYEKFEEDRSWDGLKGYITNTNLSKEEIIENYNNLWVVEKAFRMSKTDLRIRPIYHRLKRRIEAHICISFVAYTIYKELERVLKLEGSVISIEKAREITLNMYAIEIELPESKIKKNILLKLDENQQYLVKILDKHFWVSQC